MTTHGISDVAAFDEVLLIERMRAGLACAGRNEIGLVFIHGLKSLLADKEWRRY